MATKLVLHTDRISEEQQAQVDQLLNKIVPADIPVEKYNHNMEISWRDINKYANCVTAEDVYNVNPEVNQNPEQSSGHGYQFKDICSDGSIPYPFDSLTSIQTTGGYAENMFSQLKLDGQNIKKVELLMPALTGWTGSCNFDELYLDAPNLKSFTENYVKGLRRFACNSLIIENINNLAWQAPIESIECDFDNLKSGKICDLSKDTSILDKKSVLRICRTIPPWSSGEHALYLGIHCDHEDDVDVMQAIANAEGKGWTVTYQWNGIPTAQTSVTYGLRKPPIYARVSEIKCPDGTTERVVEWCHYATDLTGYEEFRSVKVAREYYGLPVEESI